VERATRENEHHAQRLKPGGAGTFRLLQNSVLLERCTGIPAALHLVAGFFRGAGYTECSKTPPSHRQSIPKSLATEESLPGFLQTWPLSLSTLNISGHFWTLGSI